MTKILLKASFDFYLDKKQLKKKPKLQTCLPVFKSALCSYGGGDIVYICTEACSNSAKQIYLQFFFRPLSKQCNFEAPGIKPWNLKIDFLRQKKPQTKQNKNQTKQTNKQNQNPKLELLDKMNFLSGPSLWSPSNSHWWQT